MNTKALPMTKAEMVRLAEAKASNPRGKVASQLNEDLKTLKHKDRWSIVISCDSVLLEEEKQKFQVWGEIGRLTRLWKYYASEAPAEEKDEDEVAGTDSSGGDETTSFQDKAATISLQDEAASGGEETISSQDEAATNSLLDEDATISLQEETVSGRDETVSLQNEASGGTESDGGEELDSVNMNVDDG